MSGCGHKFCADCHIESTTQERTYCPFCREEFPCIVFETTEKLLSDMTVNCRCGFDDSMEEVRLHVYSGKKKGSNASRESILSLLQSPGRAAAREEEWRARLKYLEPSSTFKLKDVLPPQDFKDFDRHAKRNRSLPHAYFDIDCDGLHLGRIYIELREDVVPKTVAKFIELTKSHGGYVGAEIDVVYKDVFCQVQHLDGPGRAVQGPTPDENFELKHYRAGTVAMANHGPDTNQSGFCITATKTPWRDGFNVVFGYVVCGVSVIKQLCEMGNVDGSIPRRVRISMCGMVNEWILPRVFSGFELFEST